MLVALYFQLPVLSIIYNLFVCKIKILLLVIYKHIY